MEKIKNAYRIVRRRILKAILYFIAVIYARPKKVGEKNIPKKRKLHNMCKSYTRIRCTSISTKPKKRSYIYWKRRIV